MVLIYSAVMTTISGGQLMRTRKVYVPLPIEIWQLG